MPEWSSDSKTALRESWQSGLSAKQIGEKLGVTRNAVMGQVGRMRARGENLPHPTPQRVERARPRPKPRGYFVLPTFAALPEKEPLPPTPVEPKLLCDLKTGECRWPINDGDPYLFCACAVLPLSPYCSVHTKKSYSGR